MNSEKVMELLSNELAAALQELEKTSMLEQRVQLSTIVKNLSESLSIFSAIPSSGFQADDISEDDELEINSLLDEKLG